MQSNSLNLTFKRILQVDPLKVDTNKLVSFLIQKTLDHLQLYCTVHRTVRVRVYYCVQQCCGAGADGAEII